MIRLTNWISLPFFWRLPFLLALARGARAQSAAPIQTGTFHKQVHLRSRRQTSPAPLIAIYCERFRSYSVLLAYSHFERQILRP